MGKWFGIARWVKLLVGFVLWKEEEKAGIGLISSGQIEGGFPELKVLKQRVRDMVQPDMGLGHSDGHKKTEVTSVSLSFCLGWLHLTCFTGDNTEFGNDTHCSRSIKCLSTASLPAPNHSRTHHHQRSRDRFSTVYSARTLISPYLSDTRPPRYLYISRSVVCPHEWQLDEGA